MSSTRFDASDEWMRRALTCDARAISRPDILIGAPGDGTIYPRFFGRAKGSHVWDVDGNQYIDYLLGYGPVILGHADERVTAEVAREWRNGGCVSPLWSPRQVELNELLTSIIPGAEVSYLMKTGSDSTSTAVRVARIFTGRDRIARWGYGGWHDWANYKPAGIPAHTLEDTVPFDLYSPRTLAEVFRRYPGQIAAVVTMPFEYETIEAHQLAEVRDIAHSNGALFILDEMRSGFRMGLGGAQEYFGIHADIATFSKAMANGHPISAVVGRRDVLQCLDQTRISSTYFAGPADMVAAITTIGILRDTEALAHIWRMGTALQQGLRALIEEFSLPAKVVGFPPAPFLLFTAENNDIQAAMTYEFFRHTTRGGVLFHPDHQWFVSAAHTMNDINVTLDVCRAAMSILTRAPTAHQA